MSSDFNKTPLRPRANSPLCSGALQRMLWATMALALLWLTINWALS